ncbi:MAG: ATP-binding protein [Alphaproteobacteria bacterium]|nr:ATP-binding protein [Alphaproteobacteria bacterium]
MRPVSETAIQGRLAFDNPWWREGRDYRPEFTRRRSYFEPFFKLAAERSVRRAVILMGPRRVGKTVMLQQMVAELIAGGADPKTILYASLDTPVYLDLRLEDFVRLFREVHGHPVRRRLFVLFDEVQYFAGWEIHLKSLVDSYPSIRFVASGSAAAALRMKTRESGSGRFTDFTLPPLSFAEYLRFIGREEELIRKADPGEIVTFATTDIEALNAEFVNYLNYGGYPESVLIPEVRRDAPRYIGGDIIDKVMLRDLPTLYGIADVRELYRLFTTLAHNTSSEVSVQGLAQASGVAKNTLRKYLEYLDAAFLIIRLTRIADTGRRFRRELSFKVHLTNPSLYAALFGSVTADHEAMGRLAETATVAQWQNPHGYMAPIRYARWKHGEVDIVYNHVREQSPLWATEVKWSDRAFHRPNEELAGLVVFCKANPSLLRPPFVTTRTQAGDQTVDGIVVRYVPTSLHCYAIGRTLVFEGPR